jgi:hypothetical protein
LAIANEEVKKMAKDKKRYENLNQLVKDLALNAGAIDVGIVTAETLEGGPPSTDLSYVLRGARSAVVFALPLDPEKIEKFLIPEKDEEFLIALVSTVKPYAFRPRPGIGFYHALLPGNKGQLTCRHCQIICHPDKDIRKKRFKMLIDAGVVIQLEDGSLKAVSPEEAREYLGAMSPEKQMLYENVV